MLLVANGSVSHSLERHDDDAEGLSMARAALDDIILGTMNLSDSIVAGSVDLTGDADTVRDFIWLLDTFEFWFNIVTP